LKFHHSNTHFYTQSSPKKKEKKVEKKDSAHLFCFILFAHLCGLLHDVCEALFRQKIGKNVRKMMKKK